MNKILCGAAVGGRYGVTGANMSVVAAAGLDRVEIPFVEQHFDYHDVKCVAEAAKGLAESGVECRSVHLGFEDDYDVSSADEDIRRGTLDDMKQSLTAATALGARLAVIHGSSEPIEDEERVLRIGILRESLQELTDAAAGEGVTLALELLPRTCLGNTTREALEIVKGLDEDKIGFCLDVNHVNLREDPADAVRALGKRILTFHISDNDGVDERHWFPGEGIIDWNSFMAAVREIGYAGQFIFETGGSLMDDPSEYLREIRKRFDGLTVP